MRVLSLFVLWSFSVWYFMHNVFESLEKRLMMDLVSSPQQPHYSAIMKVHVGDQSDWGHWEEIQNTIQCWVNVNVWSAFLSSYQDHCADFVLTEHPSTFLRLLLYLDTQIDWSLNSNPNVGGNNLNIKMMAVGGMLRMKGMPGSYRWMLFVVCSHTCPCF